ncbi:cell cycle checkpoint control protein RAD9A-like, partial [Teleopsis dalmanni]|uniref:cell cycle checkpoint control protein RAD9A-like n=1 Tax=Teleopsis dalmanni TaxID=139649 RepID=UPI0018CEB5C2
ASEFDHYNVSHKCHVTFCLKEFRAFLIFAESLNENLSLNLDDAGSPIFLKIKKYDQIECLLIMSTLSPDDISFYEDCNPAELTNANISIKRKLNVHDDEHKNQSKTRFISDASTLSNDSRLFDDNGNTQSASKSVNTPQNLLNNVSHICDSHVSLRMPPDSILKDTDSPVAFYDAGEIENECIPSSPGRNTNRMRSIFVRCFESTYVPKEPKPGCNVYISDSDAD